MIWILSILSALAFYIGGRSWGHKLVRRLGCPILALCWIWLNLKSFNLMALVAFFALNYGALSTYFDIFGKKGILPNGETFTEETPICWVMTGIGYGLSALPLVWCGINWYAVLIRTVILAVAIWLIRKVGNAHIEEAGSGFLYLITMGILKI